jgi:oligopeptide transport system substrate-binding protein
MIICMEYAVGYDPVSSVWLVPNTRLRVFSSKKMRHIFSHAIDRKKTEHFIPAYTPIHFEHSSFPHYMPSKMENLESHFHETLKELGIDKFPKVTILYSECRARYKIALDMQRQLRETLGITVDVQMGKCKDFFLPIISGNFSIALIGWTAYRIDPLYTLQSFISADDEVNFSNWENKEYQRLMSMEHIQVSSIKKAEKILLDEMPVIPLFHVDKKYLK